jgi:glycosyltransferase involved in cell wall biosynthesis
MQVVGTVGRLDEQKAPLDFVAAFARLGRDDVLGVWVGDGPLRAAVERDVRDRGLEDRMLLLGHRRDVPDLLPAFDVFALSSLYEGVPCAVVEAIRCGIPVVATAVNGVHEVVVPGRSGLLVPPRDPRALARAMAALLDDPVEGARLATIAQRQLEGHFVTRGLGDDLMETYEVALRTRPRVDAGVDLGPLVAHQTPSPPAAALVEQHA